MVHFYCLAVEAVFYIDAVLCLPVTPATWVRFPAGAGKIVGSTTYTQTSLCSLFLSLETTNAFRSVA